VDLRKVAHALRITWWAVALGAVIGSALAVLLSLLMEPRYTTHMQFFVSTADSASMADIYQGNQFAQERVASYARLLEGEALARRLTNQFDLGTSVKEFQDRVTATPVPETVLIDVSVTGNSAAEAQAVAAKLGEEFISMVEQLETPASASDSAVRVALTDSPGLPSEPSEPRVARNVALGLAGGLLFGSFIAVARDLLDRSVKHHEEAAELAGAPVVGVVLRDQELAKRHLADRVKGQAAAEAYRRLCTNIQFLDVDTPPSVIMVSSALPAEGKSTLVANLGLALADVGRRVVLVEADLRRPQLANYLGLVGGVGLTNVLVGTADVDDVMQRYRDGVGVIAAGPVPPNPGALLASESMATLLSKLRSEYDFVLVDAPPLLPVADSAGLSVLTDGVLLCVRYGSTRKDQLRQAAATVGQVGGRTLGVIVNMVPRTSSMTGAYGYDYS
jgi:capsular exopolysaccharide synthesis family protein